MFILHIHFHSNSTKKTIYYAINVTLTEAELHAVKCEINQAIQISEASHTIAVVIMKPLRWFRD